MKSFEHLVAEAEAEPIEGWDFSWFEGRASEDRPSWAYRQLAAERLGRAHSALDLQTAGGEFLTSLGVTPCERLVATESWLPNLAFANQALRTVGASLVATDDGVLPFRAASFDLVVARHPVGTPWLDIGRILVPNGTFLSQQVAAGSNRELTDFMMGAQPISDRRSAERHRSLAEAAGLEVIDLRQESLRAEFFDIGAVVYFLRKVPWTVPGFTVAKFEGRLREMHKRIERDGSFVSHAERFLIEARKPSP